MQNTCKKVLWLQYFHKNFFVVSCYWDEWIVFNWKTYTKRNISKFYPHYPWIFTCYVGIEFWFYSSMNESDSFFKRKKEKYSIICCTSWI